MGAAAASFYHQGGIVVTSLYTATWAVAGLLIMGCQTPAATTPAIEQPMQTSLRAGPVSNGAVVYPSATRADSLDVVHGVPVADPYRWLEDAKSEETRRWSAEEGQLARRFLDGSRYRPTLLRELTADLQIMEVRTPVLRAGALFIARTNAGEEKRSVVRVIDNQLRVILDANTEPFSIRGFWPSPDGRKLLYKASEQNRDVSVLRLRDVDTGKDSPVDTISPVRFGDPSWSADSKGFYYRLYSSDSSIPSNERPGHVEVRYHALGTAPSSDILVRPRTNDSSIFEQVTASPDGDFVFLTVSHGYAQNDLYYRRVGERDWRPIVVGRPHRYDVQSYKDTFYILTDDGAPRGRLVRTTAEHADYANWSDVVPAQDSLTIEAFAIADERLVIQYQRDATSSIEVRGLDGRNAATVRLPGIGAVYNLSGNSDGHAISFAFTSYVVPFAAYRLRPKNLELTLLQRGDSSPHASDYVVEQIFATSSDGTRIPIFLTHHRRVRPDGAAPAMIFVYGGFGSSVNPVYDPSIFPWLDAGGVYAEAVVRGGGEYGERWHRDGMRTKKQNSINDFVAAATHLVSSKWAAGTKLVARGASNGGMIVAAAVTQHPELFRAAICSAPLTDMIRYVQWGNGKIWASEYGSPENEEEFRALLAYSPYHHVRKGTKYPSILVTAPEEDDRVDSLHSRKFVAALQWATTGGPVLLNIVHEGGHIGNGTVSAWIKEQTDAYVFAFEALAE